MKKILAVIMAVLVVFSATITMAFASETEEKSYDELVDLFKVDTASNGQKYAAFEPELEVGVKYPLVVYVHGLGHAWNDTSFKQSGLNWWARNDMQSKFIEGGAYLYMPKIPETVITATQHEKVFAAIDEYVKAHADTIDTNQIYVMGGSAGGALTWRLLINHPGYFRRGVALCACKFVSASDAEAVKDTPIWTIDAKKDPFVWFSIFGGPNWNALKKASNVNSENRHTVFSDSVTLPDGSTASIAHLLAKTIGYNLCTISDKQLFPDMTTVDGNGNEVQLSFENSIVEWLQAGLTE